MTNYRPSAAELEQKFIAWWKKKRKYKARFIITNGLAYGLTVAVGSYLLFIRFDFSGFNAIYLTISTIAHISGGILLAYGFYRAQEKRFTRLNSHTN